VWVQDAVEVSTRGRGFYDITEMVAARVRAAGTRIGLCHLFVQHTSAGLCITENADPEVRRDLERFAQRLAPDGDPLFQHDAEGPDDMPAHVRSLTLGLQLTVPIHNAAVALGTWQGIYLWEHRRDGLSRRIVLTLYGER
jgi:secondary thiamine-phosphate synthase enzyme